MKKMLLFALLFSFTLNGLAQFKKSNGSLKNFVSTVNLINQNYFQRNFSTNYQSLTNVDLTLPNASNTLVEQDVYSYDSFGRDLISEEINYNTNNGSVTSKEKTEYYYDAQEGWLDYELVYDFDTNTMQYNLASKSDVLLYDAGLRLPLEIVYATYNSGSWFNQEKSIYTYDTSGNVLTEVEKTWSSGWVNSSKEENTYNPGGQIMERILSYWNGSVWQNSTKYTYTYDAQLRLSVRTVYQMISGTYIFQSKNTYSYNPGGELLDIITQEWDGTQWLDIHKENWTYDASGNVLTETDYDYTSGAWAPDDKLDFTNYNNAYTRADLLLPTNFDSNENVEYFNHQINDVTSSGWDGSAWQVQMNIHLTYQPISVAGVDSISFADVQVYPNPTTDNLYINSDKALTISIFDLSGKQILTNNLKQGKNTINISQLQTGIYLATIYSNNNSATLKIVKR